MGYLTLALFLTVLLTQFTNCDVYSNNSLFQTLSTECVEVDCVGQNPDFIEIKLFTDQGEFYVANDASTFDLGGECNEGGFAKNQIVWTLKTAQQALIHNSIQAGVTAHCEMGRFQIKIILNPVGATVNRTGLRNANGTPVPHYLDIEIIPYDEADKPMEGTLGRQSVILRPAP